MRIKEDIPKKCSECGHRTGTLQEESFGCDNCKKPIDEQLNNPDNQHRHYLEVRVFHSDDRTTEGLQFCSWACVLAKLPKIKADYFITLPYLTFDNKLEKGIRAQDFFKAIRGRVPSTPEGSTD